MKLSLGVSQLKHLFFELLPELLIFNPLIFQFYSVALLHFFNLVMLPIE